LKDDDDEIQWLTLGQCTRPKDNQNHRHVEDTKIGAAWSHSSKRRTL